MPKAESLMTLTTISATADILSNPETPRVISDKDSQLLYGEQFQVLESRGAYVFGKTLLDGYEGYVEREQLVKDMSPSDYIVKAHMSYLYPEPDFRSRPKMALSFLSRVTATGKTQDSFSELEDGDWICSDHIAPIDGFKMPGDLVDTASLYLRTPYLYGGRSVFGIDCSGLIQKTLVAQGYDCPPRDSEKQAGAFGKKIKDVKDLKRNDIVYFDGHVGIMTDDKNILNATRRHMMVVIEPLTDLKKFYGDITYIARL